MLEERWERDSFSSLPFSDSVNCVRVCCWCYYYSLWNVFGKQQGLWMGIICGLFVQVLLFSAIAYCTNWEKEVSAPLILFLTDTAYFNSTGSLFCEQSCRGWVYMLFSPTMLDAVVAGIKALLMLTVNPLLLACTFVSAFIHGVSYSFRLGRRRTEWSTPPSPKTLQHDGMIMWSSCKLLAVRTAMRSREENAIVTVWHQKNCWK